ncbi:MAG: hypothetical protein ACK6D4_08355 [Planctomyces sp.]
MVSLWGSRCASGSLLRLTEGSPVSNLFSGATGRLGTSAGGAGSAGCGVGCGGSAGLSGSPVPDSLEAIVSAGICVGVSDFAPVSDCCVFAGGGELADAAGLLWEDDVWAGTDRRVATVLRIASIASSRIATAAAAIPCCGLTMGSADSDRGPV